jgi:CBS domain containing-hemolysin-like protein
MGKQESNALIFLLSLVVGILFALLFLALLEAGKYKGKLDQSTRENDRAAIALRESREKLEKLLKAVKSTEKGEQ